MDEANDRKVTIGLIGIGEILGLHLEALRANPEYELISICGLSEAQVRKTAAAQGCKGFTDYCDLLAEKPDVVLVSLPHGLHCRVTVEALAAGCHVLVEKPMAVTVTSAGRCSTRRASTAGT